MRFNELITESQALNDEQEISEFLTDSLGIDSDDFDINSDLSVTLHTDLNIDAVNGLAIKRLPIKFKEIQGDVWINNCVIDSLIGLPAEINGSVILLNTRIKNLKFCPKLTGEESDLILQHNRNLESLEGCPVEIPNNFDLSDNHAIKSLENGPKKVGRNYKVDTCDGLETISGIAEEIGKHLSLCNNRKLESLEGISKKIKHCGGKLDVSGSHFKSAIMGVVVVKGITGLEYKFGGEATRAFDIIFACRNQGKDALECQDLLIDAGLQRFAKL